MSETSSRKPLQKVLILVSSFAFIASSIFGLMSNFNPEKPESNKAQNVESARLRELQQYQQGFESVLKREPKNQAALQGNQTALQEIVDIKIASKDYKGGIPYVEKLVKLNPNQPSYQALLATFKKEAQKTVTVPDVNNSAKP